MGRPPPVLAHQLASAYEDLTLTFAGANNGIIADIPHRSTVDPSRDDWHVSDEAGYISLHRVIMRWLLYGGDLRIDEANDILKDTTRVNENYGAHGFLLACGGRNISIQDCDLYSSGNLFNLVGSVSARITNNRFSIGRCGWANFDGCDGVICEDNDFLGADHMVRHGVTFASILPMRNVYFARNKIDNVYFHDREGMTTDGADGKYLGPIDSATANSVTVPTETTSGPSTPFVPDELKGHLCFVIGGTGQGQSRTVVANTDWTLTVDPPWDVLPEKADSIIGINHEVSHFLVIRNTLKDVGSAFVFYGTAMNSIVAENRCTRACGLWSYAARYAPKPTKQDDQPQFFIQYLDNMIVEGMTPRYVYNDTYLERSVIRITSHPGTDGESERTWPLALGFIFRRNKLNSWAYIELWARSAAATKSPLIKDVIVENNIISCTDTGIKVSAWTTGIVVRKNTFHEVDTPLDGAGLASAIRDFPDER